MNRAEEAGVALAIGSVGAPVLYVILGYARPTGFVDFTGSELSVPVTYFFTAWFFSALLVLPIGGLFWRTLHAKGIDGFTSYSVVAILSALILYFAAAGSDLTGTALMAAMAVFNALLVRTAELILRKAQVRNHEVGA